MRIKLIGGVPTLILEKSEVGRLLDAVYIGAHMEREVATFSAAEAEEIKTAAATFKKYVTRFGAKHLTEAGTLKPTQRDKTRDESEAPAAAKKGGSGP